MISSGNLDVTKNAKKMSRRGCGKLRIGSIRNIRVGWRVWPMRSRGISKILGLQLAANNGRGQEKFLWGS